MPLNTLRLNHQKSAHPNDRVVFIKPLPRPPSEQASYDVADTFLRAIAAQCLPLMKKHYLSVTTLEEYEPNPEFIGRNFNNGEIIQLVLRTKDGRWVPFNAVQMVMMHELAHNTHMNHGKDFWKTRNLYADDMKALWAKGYTGEGFWGGGRTLTDMGSVMGNNVLRSGELDSLPLCGGTFRSRNRKRRGRKDKPELTWREKRDRRIEKKFGKNGVALGEDEDKRINLEINRKGPVGGKPRVAQSARGRELRAAAALARFETNKKEVIDLQLTEATQSESGDDEDDYEDLDANHEDARDAQGRKILDNKGQGMIRVCDDEDTDNADAQHELHELNTLDRYFNSFRLDPEPPMKSASQKFLTSTDSGLTPKSTKALESDTTVDSGQSPQADPVTGYPPSPRTSICPASKGPLSSAVPMIPDADASKAADARPTRKAAAVLSKTNSVETTNSTSRSITPVNQNHTSTEAPGAQPAPMAAQPLMITCPICSLENPRLNATCLACSHVIDPRKDPKHWACHSEACRDSGTAYLNAGDVAICAVCGARRSS